MCIQGQAETIITTLQNNEISLIKMMKFFIYACFVTSDGTKYQKPDDQNSFIVAILKMNGAGFVFFLFEVRQQ